MTNKNAEIGVVEDVLAMTETGQAQPLLHVCAPFDAQQQVEGDPREEHLIPYVPQIVPHVDTKSGVVYVQPPAGLLQLGRQQLQLRTLQRDLEPFTHPPPLGLLSRLGLRLMPTPAQLEEAGRRDLVGAVRRAGGFLEVAQALGLRSQRKPAGFWEDEAHLDEELTLFVAAHWTEFRDPESRQEYWYNQITHRINWERPVLPQRVAIDDEGGFILTEAEEDRVMPSRSAICAAGRYDLYHAILQHGGFTAAAELLHRRPAWPPTQHLASLPRLRHELRAFLLETGLPVSRLPTASQLADAGRGDLLQAIVRRGGFSATAAALGWTTQRRQRGAWQDTEAVAAELHRFILDSQLPPDARALGGRGRRGGGKQAREEEGVEEAPLPADARMPTQHELTSAGRHDLKYAVQQHGSAKLAAMLGIGRDPRGAHNRRRLPPEAAQPEGEQTASPPL